MMLAGPGADWAGKLLLLVLVLVLALVVVLLLRLLILLLLLPEMASQRTDERKEVLTRSQ